jgi:hypothetical protein
MKVIFSRGEILPTQPHFIPEDAAKTATADEKKQPQTEALATTTAHRAAEREAGGREAQAEPTTQAAQTPAT